MFCTAWPEEHVIVQCLMIVSIDAGVSSYLHFVMLERTWIMARSVTSISRTLCYVSVLSVCFICCLWT